MAPPFLEVHGRLAQMHRGQQQPARHQRRMAGGQRRREGGVVLVDQRVEQHQRGEAARRCAECVQVGHLEAAGRVAGAGLRDHRP
jgi:hypothetical protein